MCDKETKFKVGQVVKTRDGRDARVICVDKVGDYPMIALINDGLYDDKLKEGA